MSGRIESVGVLSRSTILRTGDQEHVCPRPFAVGAILARRSLSKRTKNSNSGCVRESARNRLVSRETQQAGAYLYFPELGRYREKILIE